MKRCYYALTLFLLICCNSSLLVQGVSPHGVTDHQKLLAELDHLQTSLDKCDQEKKQLRKENHLLQQELNNCNEINERIQAPLFGNSDASTVSEDPTYADSEASDAPDSSSVYMDKLEDSNQTLAAHNQTLEDHLADCEQVKERKRELEKIILLLEQQIEQKQEALRNCQQLSGAAKVGAGAAGLSQLKSMDKNLSFKDTRGFILKFLNEGGFILFKQAAKETIPQVPIVHWEGRSLLDTHEVAEITAEALKAYAHDKDPKDLALFSAQVYARVKIMNQLDKHGFKKMTDKLEYHTRTLIRGLVCKGIDVGIATLVETYYRP